jgi:hypothetical protein
MKQVIKTYLNLRQIKTNIELGLIKEKVEEQASSGIYIK